MGYMFFIYAPNLYEGWGFSLLFIFCSLKALPNIKLIKKSHRPIITKTTTPEVLQQQNTVWAYSRKYPLQDMGKTTANA
ncbi:hypothetical protein [Nostoc sp. NMS1]|uniref:hypothetical protein n=1 Tax=Nostoc sp. NMS1 TaxID=2815388 RepID=UPI0026010F1F|nr:hypothetical protein [Nostoc sp. NMS1]